MAGNQNSGGKRVGAGRKKKPLADKVADGKNEKIMVMEFADLPDLTGEKMPNPNEILLETQKDGTNLQAKEIYESAWKWLDERGCSALISPQLLDRYAMAAARWIHCEKTISATGYLAKHPTTGNAIQSPFVAMSQNYMNQTNRLWNEIFNIVRENSMSEYSGINPQEDMMERLLRSRSKL